METFGFLIAILMTFINALKEISIKNNLKNIDSNTLIFILSSLSIILWLPFIIFYGIPELSLRFWGVFFLSGTLFYIGKLFNFKAIQAEEISYIAPLKSLPTLGAFILGMIILNEFPNFIGFIGFIVVLFGVYILNLQKYHTKFFDPIIHLFKNKGAKLYLVSAIAYSFTIILDKIGVLETYPIFWIFMMNLFLFIISFNNFKKNIVKNKQIVIKNYKFIVITFILYALSLLTQMTAIQYIFASYVSLIKLAGILFVIILGGIFFKEKDIVRKLLVGIIIVLGVTLVYLS